MGDLDLHACCRLCGVWSDLLDDAGFQLHGADAVDFGFDVVVADAGCEPDVADFGAGFDSGGAAFDLQGFDHGDGVAVGQDVAHRVFDHAAVGMAASGINGRFPFVGAFGADQHGAQLVGEGAGALRAWRQGLIHAVIVGSKRRRGAGETTTVAWVTQSAQWLMSRIEEVFNCCVPPAGENWVRVVEVPLYQHKAEFFRTLGHPVRIRVLELLGDGPLPVRDLLADVAIEASSLSHQLAVLRRAGIVTSYREGAVVMYALSGPDVADLMTAARRFLTGVLTSQARLLRALRDADTPSDDSAAVVAAK